MKAIETEYNGYKFRSRLEARWAVFFDAAGIKYEYEPEGFELEDGTKYLPDFYLPEYDWYVEVKPPRDSAVDDIIKASKFVGEKIKVLLLLGNIPPETDIDVYHYNALYKNPLSNKLTIGSVCCCSCYEDDLRLKMEFITWLYIDMSRWKTIFTEHGITADILNAIHDKGLTEGKSDPNRTYPYCEVLKDDPEIRYFINSCYKKARQARFEHGEKPYVNSLR